MLTIAKIIAIQWGNVMHYISGLGLKFTSRTSWKADVYKAGKVIATVPVAWIDQVVFNRDEKRPQSFLVWLTTIEKAKEFLSKEEAIIAVAISHDPKEHPRKFKEFSRLFKVKPRSVGDDPRSVTCDYIDVVTADSFE
jgi:hypothetical protein